MSRCPKGAEMAYGGMVLEDGLHPDDPKERAIQEALLKAKQKANELYGEEEGEDEDGED